MINLSIIEILRIITGAALLGLYLLTILIVGIIVTKCVAPKRCGPPMKRPTPKPRPKTPTFELPKVKDCPFAPNMKRPKHKKAQISIITAMIVAGFTVPTINQIGTILPTLRILNSTANIVKSVPAINDVIITNHEIKDKNNPGACVRTFSHIIKIKQWYVEPHMEYMFSGWLIAYNKVRGKLI